MPDEARLYRDDYGRTWKGPFPFSLDEIGQVPSQVKGVYQILSRQKDAWVVAYIGIATGATIRARLRSHFNGRSNWALGRLERPHEMEFVYFECDALMATTIETHVVTFAKPPFNTRPEYRNLMQSIAIH